MRIVPTLRPPFRVYGAAAGPHRIEGLRIPAWVLMLFVAVACGGGPPSSTSSSSNRPQPSEPSDSPDSTPSDGQISAPPVLTEDELPLSCGSPLAFGDEALQSPPGVETASHPLAEALRALVADSPLPKRPGWRLVAFSEVQALFLLPATPEEGSAFWSAEFERRGSDWAYVRSGQCDIRPALGNIEPARWELAPGEIPDPETRELSVLVTELGCASGNSPEGRIVPAAIIYSEEAVTVIFGTRPPPGAQTCLQGPAAPATVTLHEPLGDRRLFDGHVIPPEPRS
jgi:hypothetical protein